METAIRNIMSRSTIHTYTCPCGQEFEGPVYDYVNVAKEPRLRYIVLAGLLNTAACPVCGLHAVVAHPFIYSDPQYKLLAYVHPRSDAPAEARQLILERLRSVYVDVACAQEALVARHDHAQKISSAEARAMPPLKVAFGLDQLADLINAVLGPDDRLGKLALSTHSADSAERAQLLVIARKLASDMDCTSEVEDLPSEYTVWLYGARRDIGSLVRSLATTL